MQRRNIYNNFISFWQRRLVGRRRRGCHCRGWREAWLRNDGRSVSAEKLLLFLAMVI
jgi:hypothetical protein